MQTLKIRQKQLVACIAAIVVASCVVTVAQQPDNAALLYYQAFLLHEKPDETLSKTIDDYRRRKTASSDAITQYIEKNRRVVDLVVRAADIAKCDWGYDYSQGTELTMPNLAQIRQIAFLLAAEARWQADKGDYRTALDHCMVLRKMALNVCDKMLISYLVGIAIDALTNRVTEGILSSSPLDADTLSQLRSDTTQIAGQFPSSAVCLDLKAEVCAMTMTRERMRTQIQLAREMADDEVVKRLEQGDEAFYDRNRRYYLDMIDKLTSILGAHKSYAQTCESLDNVATQFAKQTEDNPDATLASLNLHPASIKRIYQLAIRKQTHVNAIVAAIDVYLVRAQTGQLPARLPATCPPDLFSGKPFVYTKTADGFTLRCQGKEDPGEDKVHEYEFKITR